MKELWVVASTPDNIIRIVLVSAFVVGALLGAVAFVSLGGL